MIDEAPWGDYSRSRLPRGLAYVVGRDTVEHALRQAGATIGSLSLGPPPRPHRDDNGQMVFDVYWVGDARSSVSANAYHGAPATRHLLMRWHAVPSSIRADVADEVTQHWLPLACMWAAAALRRGNTWKATDHRWLVMLADGTLTLVEDGEGLT